MCSCLQACESDNIDSEFIHDLRVENQDLQVSVRHSLQGHDMGCSLLWHKSSFLVWTMAPIKIQSYASGHFQFDHQGIPSAIVFEDARHRSDLDIHFANLSTAGSSSTTAGILTAKTSRTETFSTNSNCFLFWIPLTSFPFPHFAFLSTRGSAK